jgi:hypothetical protein
MSCAAPLLAPPQDLHRPGAGVPPGSRGPQPGHTPPGQYATSGTVPRAIGGTSLASVTRAASLGESEGHVLAQGMTALGLVRLYNPRGPTKASSKPIHFRAPAEPRLSGTAGGIVRLLGLRSGGGRQAPDRTAPTGGLIGADPPPEGGRTVTFGFSTELPVRRCTRSTGFR